MFFARIFFVETNPLHGKERLGYCDTAVLVVAVSFFMVFDPGTQGEPFGVIFCRVCYLVKTCIVISVIRIPNKTCRF